MVKRNIKIQKEDISSRGQHRLAVAKDGQTKLSEISIAAQIGYQVRIIVISQM